MQRLRPEQEAALATSAAGSEEWALAELRALLPSVSVPSVLAPGVALLRPGIPYDAFADRVLVARPVFVRHLAPVQAEATLRDSPADVDVLREAAIVVAAGLAAGTRFSVQSRLLGPGPHALRKVEVNEACSDAIAARTGALLDCRSPEWIVSLTMSGAWAGAGLSLAARNRSAWPGGERRFRHEEARVSRAEFKLLEAIEAFGIAVPEKGVALDLGAAPGGWTRALRERGLRVIAVDPADLDPRVAADRGVTHVRARVEDFLPRAPRVDFLACDLRMDAANAVRVLLSAGRFLRPSADALTTLKLPEKAPARGSWPRIVDNALQQLATRYEVVDARQLFHCRSEICVALRAR